MVKHEYHYNFAVFEPYTLEYIFVQFTSCGVRCSAYVRRNCGVDVLDDETKKRKESERVCLATNCCVCTT